MLIYTDNSDTPQHFLPQNIKMRREGDVQRVSAVSPFILPPSTGVRTHEVRISQRTLTRCSLAGGAVAFTVCLTLNKRFRDLGSCMCVDEPRIQLLGCLRMLRSNAAMCKPLIKNRP